MLIAQQLGKSTFARQHYQAPLGTRSVGNSAEPFDIRLGYEISTTHNTERSQMMKLILCTICVLACASLYSCAYSKPSPNLEYAITNSIPTCTEGVDCAKKWEAAQIWIANNVRSKISIVTSALIETKESETELFVRVTKELQDSLNYKIKFVAGCKNVFGCFPDPNESNLEFNQFVNSYGQPKLQPELEVESLNKNGSYDKQWKN